MDKRYQVFVSSTYRDLQEERREVIQALLELDCIPAGMELFPAADEDQWSLIKRVIDDCDYYIVIVGGRYGSVSSDGISYTQMEYEYAVSQRKPIIGFVHSDPTLIPAAKTEQSEEGKQKLEEFRELVQQKMCRFWSNPAELGSVVSRSLVKLIKTKPAVGWIKADQESPELLQQLQQAREKIEELEEQAEQLKSELDSREYSEEDTEPPPSAEKFAKGEDKVRLHCYITSKENGKQEKVSLQVSWDTLFVHVGPGLEAKVSDTSFRTRLSNGLQRILERQGKFPLAKKVSIDVEDSQKVKYQFWGLGLIGKINHNWGEPSWTLTEYGRQYLVSILTQQKR